MYLNKVTYSIMGWIHLKFVPLPFALLYVTWRGDNLRKWSYNTYNNETCTNKLVSNLIILKNRQPEIHETTQ